MYISLYELKTNTIAFLATTEAIYSPNLNATAQRVLKRLNELDRNTLSVSEFYNLIFDNTVLPWRKQATTQQLMYDILGGVQYA